MSRYATDEDYEAAEGWVDPESPSTAEETEPDEPTSEEEEGEAGEVGDEEPDGEGHVDPAAETSEDEDEGDDESTIELSVAGEVVNWTRKEIEAGVLRQADYTRKTQQLAAERRSLAAANDIVSALDRNPVETLAKIAQHYGVPWGNDPYAEPPEGPTPEQQAIREMVAWREQQEARQREWQVDNEVARLHQEYGEFTDDELFQFAVDNQIPNLESALRAMTWDRSPRVNGKRTEKRKVQGIAGGQGRSPAVAPRREPEKIGTFRDAYDAAKREIEARS